MANDSTGLTEIVNAPADKIIDALTDFDTFPDWQAAVLECEVLERDDEGRGSLVRMKVDAKIRKVDYVVRYTYDLPNSLGWDQESGDLKENTGTYTFTPARRRHDRGDGRHRRRGGLLRSRPDEEADPRPVAEELDPRAQEARRSLSTRSSDVTRSIARRHR